MGMIVLLMANLTYVQVVKADDYRNNQANRRTVLVPTRAPAALPPSSRPATADPADVPAFNKAVYAALKPGGVFVILDHADAALQPILFIAGPRRLERGREHRGREQQRGAHRGVRLRLTYLALALVVILGAVPVPGLAQGRVPDLSEMSLEDRMNIEITSASRKEQRIGDVPAAISVLTKAPEVAMPIARPASPRCASA